jgi:putative phage-type endonuclease
MSSQVIQETISLDGFIDKCIKMKFPDASIAECANMIFGGPSSIGQDYIVKRKVLLQSYQMQLQELIQIPIVVQRSQEWFDSRKTLITASDFAQALGEGKFGTKRDIFKKKCGFEQEVKLSPNSMAPLKWGVMFEPIAQNIYSQRTRMKIYEFGLIRHPDPKRSYFGASPDGINEYGIMLEIKCPFIRKITGEVPLQYYYQIQGQLDVCGLHECDYLECQFQKVDALDPNYGMEQGTFLEYPGEDSSEYVYDNIKETMENRQGYIVHHWQLVKYNVVRVYKDEEFVTAKLDALEQVWKQIEMYQGNKNVYDKEVKLSGRHAATNESAKITGYSFI